MSYMVVVFQIGDLEALIVVDFDESSMELNDEISEYLSAFDDVLTYYNEHGQVKLVRFQSFILSYLFVDVYWIFIRYLQRHYVTSLL